MSAIFGFFCIASLITFLIVFTVELKDSQPYYRGWGPFGKAVTISGWVFVCGLMLLIAIDIKGGAPGVILAPGIMWQVFTSGCWDS